MVRAWSPSRAQWRVRGYAGPMRLLALAVLVFSLVIAHGVSCGNTDGRTAHGAAAGAVASAPGSAAYHEHGHEHGHDPAHGHEHGHGHDRESDADSDSEQDDPHTGGECVSGQPQQGPVLNAPCPVPFAQDAGGAHATGEAVPPEPGPAVTPLAASRRSVVQRI